MTIQPDWLAQVKWDSNGLIAAIAQDHLDGEVLTLAWMNQEALSLTIEEQRAVYWSRSRNKIWRKGEESGHVQLLKAIYLDCDADAVLLKVEQVGGIACHTGRKGCFFQKFEKDQWVTASDVIKDPKQIYQKDPDS